MKIEILQTAAQVNAKAAWHFIRRAAFDGVLTRRRNRRYHKGRIRAGCRPL